MDSVIERTARRNEPSARAVEKIDCPFFLPTGRKERPVIGKKDGRSNLKRAGRNSVGLSNILDGEL